MFEGSSFSLSSPILIITCYFDDSFPSEFEVVSHCEFASPPPPRPCPMAKAVEYLFIYLPAIYVFPLGNVYSDFFSPFKIGLGLYY